MIFGIRILKGGAEVNINATACRCDCGATIYWARTKKHGKLMPVIFKDGDWQSHFADCPLAKRFRKKDEEKRKQPS